MPSQYVVVNKLCNFAKCCLEASASQQLPAESIPRNSPRVMADAITYDVSSICSPLLVRKSTSNQKPFSTKLDNLSRPETAKKLFEVKPSEHSFTSTSDTETSDTVYSETEVSPSTSSNSETQTLGEITVY